MKKLYVLLIILMFIGCKNSENSKNGHEVDENKYFDLLKISQTSLFVGGKKVEDVQIVCGVYITALKDQEVEYKLNCLENWKQEFTLSGVAKLELHGGDTSILDAKNKPRPAWKLVDNKDTCMIILKVSKDKYANGSIGRIQRICKEKIEELTPLLYYK